MIILFANRMCFELNDLHIGGHLENQFKLWTIMDLNGPAMTHVLKLTGLHTSQAENARKSGVI